MNTALRRLMAALAMGFAMHSSMATQVVSASPQGEVARVRQVVLKFDSPMVAMGSASAAAPFRVSCTDAQVSKGEGRWINERTWAFDFDDDLPPGQRCTVQAVPDLKDLKGQALSGTQRYSFSTGGPQVRRSAPSAGSTIEETQHFVLRFNGALDMRTLLANSHCAVEGLGEKLPLVAITGAQRQELLSGREWEDIDPEQLATVRCQRPLPPAAKVQLVLGKGLATPSGVVTRNEQRLNFEVREPFKVSMTCERENAQSACLPIKPIRVLFNAPVDAALAQKIQLKGNKKTHKAKASADEESDEDTLIESVEFAATWEENADYQIVLPKGLKDASGREPSNAQQFPLKVSTGNMPPLVKFSASPFGVIERLADPTQPPMMPVSIRNVEDAIKALGLQAGQGTVSDLNVKDDAAIIAWYRRLLRYDERSVPRSMAVRDGIKKLPKLKSDPRRDYVESRALGLLQDNPKAQTLQLPAPAKAPNRPLELVGIPLTPGFHVLEIASTHLGQSLLDADYGAQRTMYVRSSALVTNLGVHFKLGQENAMAWVTSLDKGKPVPNAVVQVSDCRGKLISKGRTDERGVVTLKDVPPSPPVCSGDDEDYMQAYFVSARAASTPDGVQDLAFTWSDWNRGIEPWRFDLPTHMGTESPIKAHTVLDRTLLRAGETLHMKHLLRKESSKGFVRASDHPDELRITHDSSGQTFTLPLNWTATATGGMSASNEHVLPVAARLGRYSLELVNTQTDTAWVSGAFRVEEFRLPVYTGSLVLNNRQALVAADELPVNLQVSYINGGGAAMLPTRLSAQMRPQTPRFDHYEGFSFALPYNHGDDEDDNGIDGTRLIADKLPLTLDRQGQGSATLSDLPRPSGPQLVRVEATYADPNGETQTLQQSTTWWPAAVVAGIKTEGWVSAQQEVRFQALALDLQGAAAKGVKLKISARLRTTTTTRKRMVGGFYTYDNTTQTKDLGTVCQGRSDDRGLLLCNTTLRDAGEVELMVQATDSEGRNHEAGASITVTRQGELWFGGEDHDRMDVLPEKKRYQPGDTARLQVRMPFRYATALVSVEREGVMDTRVVELNGQDPTIELKIEPDWGPNVYVSVLALRGRLREVPWYSFFTWGYKAPKEWWSAYWHEGREYTAPTAMVDLSKPAYRLGVAELQIDTQANALQVQVEVDKASYQVRGQAKVSIKATLPNGKPAARAEVSLAVVDQALLELSPNPSWDVISAMWQRRPWGVETSTAQMEIVGRRHYGRKAVAPGGGGGHSATRELFDTLLLWQPRITLDAQGQATVMVKLNDAITDFAVVAVADANTSLFGTGRSVIKVTQDLQLISGLPPLVREGDQFTAMVTLRNATQKAMRVTITPTVSALSLSPQTVSIDAGQTLETTWPVQVPSSSASAPLQALQWTLQAQDQISGASDTLSVQQHVMAAQPVAVQQANLVQLDTSYTLTVQPPSAHISDAQGAPKGGVRLAMQSRLSDGLPGVKAWLQDYPFTCLEQKTARALGLGSTQQWNALLAQLPSYLDQDGMVSYFPVRDGQSNSGSDTLTAHMLAVTHEAALTQPEFALPDDARAAMERALLQFVDGSLERRFWSPRQDLPMRKIAAIEALSRYGKSHPRQIDSLEITPDVWPTHTVIDWLMVLQRTPGIPQLAERKAHALQVLRSRLSYQGTRLVFSTESTDHWWWLMQDTNTNTARLLLAVLGEPDWRDEWPKLMAGLIGRQQLGHWGTTTANLWGTLATQKFGARLESAPVSGSSRAALGASQITLDWARSPNPQATLPWPAANAPSTLTLNHTGAGKPWVTIQSLAAVNYTAPLSAGYQLSKTITPVEQAKAGQYSRGDVVKVRLDINASADMTWVALTDPIPAGSTILGSGLGRDSALASAGNGGSGGALYEERSFEGWRSYYDYLPKGKSSVEYTVRLNNAGDFALPPTRIEAMYAPEMFGLTPNPRWVVQTRP